MKDRTAYAKDLKYITKQFGMPSWKKERSGYTKFTFDGGTVELYDNRICFYVYSDSDALWFIASGPFIRPQLALAPLTNRLPHILFTHMAKKYE